MVHADVFKDNPVHHGILSPAPARLDAQSPVRVQEHAVLNGQVFYPARHLTSDGNRAMAVPHTASADGYVF